MHRIATARVHAVATSEAQSAFATAGGILAVRSLPYGPLSLPRVFEIAFVPDAADDLGAMRARDRAWVLDEIDLRLQHDPLAATRRKKPLVGLVPPWEETRALWELRVGEFRVFYDVDAKRRVVWIRRIRRKPPHRTTEDVL